MSKNNIVAFILIFASVFFFTSDLYNKSIAFVYESVMHKPYPYAVQNTTVAKPPVSEKKSETEQNKSSVTAALVSVPASGSIAASVNTVSLTNDTVVSANTSRTIIVENEKMICSISENGAVVQSVKIKDFKYTTGKEKGKIIEMIPTSSRGGANLTIDNVSFDDKKFICTSSEKVTVGGRKTDVVFNYSTGDGSTITKTFSFEKDSYKIGCSVSSGALTNRKIGVSWNSGITESEPQQTAMFTPPLLKELHYYNGEGVEHETKKKVGNDENSGMYKWVGITSKYFLIAVVADTVVDGDIIVNAFSQNNDTKKPDLNYGIGIKRMTSGSTESFWFYVGPTKANELRQYGIKLEKVLYKGYAWFFFADKWFPSLCEFVLWLLQELQKWVKDYGVVIILLTVILKVVTFPMTQSSMKSMKQMSEIQPEISKIRDKYKSKPQVMNQKLMEFYKEKNINPLAGVGGCLPLFLQMPIMISLYIVLNKAIELRGHSTVLVPWVKDLTQPEVVFNLGFEMPLYGSTVALLPILMAVLMYFQNKMTIKDPNQKAMIWMMPIMMLLMFNNFPAGLSLYFVFSSLLQLAQQLLVNGGIKTVPSVKN